MASRKADADVRGKARFQSGVAARVADNEGATCSVRVLWAFQDAAQAADARQRISNKDDFCKRIPHSVLVRELASLAERTTDDVAIRAAVGLRSRTLDVLEYIMRTAASPLQALESAAECFPLVHDGAALQLTTRVREVVLSFTLLSRLADSRHLAEFVLASLVACLRRGTGLPRVLERVSFTASAPHNTAVLEAFFGCPVEYGAGANAVLLSEDEAKQSNPNSDGILNAILLAHARDKLEQLRSTSSFPLRVRHVVARMFALGSPSEGEVAAELEMSARTMHRRLHGEGSSYREIVDDVRKGLALTYLKQTDMPLKTIARSLGYSHVSAFARAFRRWTDSRPSEVRRSRLRR
jgi:AraC-like DNA-binding protein